MIAKAPRRVHALSPLVPMLLAGAALASGGTAESLLIIADPTDPESRSAANYYKQARGVPDTNVLYIAPGASNYGAFAGANVDALLGTVAQRGIGHTDYVLVMPGAPFFVSAPGLVSDSCSPVNRFSIASAYSLAFMADEIADGGMRFSDRNEFYSSQPVPIGFDSETGWLGGEPSDASTARRYFIGAMLGYTGERGNTLQEILDLVDRSVAADGSFPAGTFYYMNNEADAARNVRAPLYDLMAAEIGSLGGNAEVLDGILPGGRHDCLGIMTGAAAPNISGATMTILPGAFTDHLTSWAATFDREQQRKVSEWIARGASGSYGAVEEPCNYTGKFPRATLHPLYFQGMTLGESVFRSLQYHPYQGLMYGDPLTRPWAHIPVVSVPDAPAGPVSGVVTLTPIATTSHPTAGIASFALLVDGVQVDTVGVGGTFQLDTTELADGHHDVRVLAADDTPVGTASRWVRVMQVNNFGRTSTLSLSVASVDLTTPVVLSLGATGGAVEEIRVWHNGRIVATADSAPAAVAVYGRTLGAGTSSLRAEVVFADSARALSAPIEVEVSDAAGTPPAVAPVAHGYSRSVGNQDPFVLELPASFGDDFADATWTVVSAPAQATVHGGTSGPYRVLVPDDDASGTDSLTFRVATPNGTSTNATITIEYVDTSCRPDLAAPFGTLDFFDILAFLFLFNSQDAAADLAHPFGTWDFFDVLEFLSLFDAGCP